MKTTLGLRLAELAENRVAKMAGRYSAIYPAVMKCLLAYREGLTGHPVVPSEHHHRIRRPNFIDRAFGGPRRRVKVIGRLLGETNCLALVWRALDRLAVADAA